LSRNNKDNQDAHSDSPWQNARNSDVLEVEAGLVLSVVKERNAGEIRTLRGQTNQEQLCCSDEHLKSKSINAKLEKATQN